ncbi:unnamed protein product [Caenorhabditis bovis]|uniref:Translation initiation factor eIF2B subunit delta n=1 Tax=Caenorhabditis bovis TaxID=2654633 RepID=A0A8S1ECC8_9PELO|nr:unnamed protein product [Caenorhabditis bovis]
MSNKKPPSTNGMQKDPVDGLKQAFAKLSEEVKHLGMVLGVNDEAATVASPAKEAKSQSEKSDNKKHEELTQEEKKAQRAAKAAEKKKRAEQAAAKKAADSQKPAKEAPKQQKPQKNAPKKEENVNENFAEVEKVVNGVANLKIDSTPPKSEPKANVKSALKQKNNVKGGPSREVQFDLLSNTSARLSDSEENLVVAIPEAPVAQLGDASAISHIHPAFLTLFARCDRELIVDLDQLCQEFIQTFREFLADFGASRVAEKADPSTFGNDLGQSMRPQIGYLTQNGARHLPYALGNIVRQLKRVIAKMDGSYYKIGSQSDVNIQQMEEIDDWLQEAARINFEPAYQAIAYYLSPKIKNAEGVLTYDWCPAVNFVLHKSIESYPDLRICFVDAELNGRGVRHVNSFVDKGYRCQYTDLKSIGYAVSQCSMVILGCSAILSNGCVATSRGSIQVALAAKAFNVPVLVISQSFKFVDKVQSYPKMALLDRENIELVPSTLVTAVVTDIRILPPTAASAVLKAKALDVDN